MKEQIETAVPRIKFVAVDNNEARKTATGHSCKPLPETLKDDTATYDSNDNKRRGN